MTERKQPSLANLKKHIKALEDELEEHVDELESADGGLAERLEVLEEKTQRLEAWARRIVAAFREHRDTK